MTNGIGVSGSARGRAWVLPKGSYQAAQASSGTSLVDMAGMALASCTSPVTRRVYAVQLAGFVGSSLPLSRQGMALHLQQLRDSGLSSSTIAVAIAAIRKLAACAMSAGLIGGDEFSRILTVGPGKILATRSRMMLTVQLVARLLALPDRSSYWGKRDACLLSILAGCGLTRSELASLKWSQYQWRGGRMWLVDITGKNHQVRSVPVPLWTQADMDRWYLTSREAPSKPPYRHLHLERARPRNMDYLGSGMSGDAVHALVQRYGQQLGRALTPSDLRRSLAKMLWRAGASFEQIQYTLGHQSRSTTAAYLIALDDCKKSPPCSVAGLAAKEDAEEAGARRRKKRGAGTGNVRRRKQLLSGSVREYLSVRYPDGIGAHALESG